MNYPITSREVSPVSKTLSSLQSTPSVAFQTPSPPALQAFNFAANGSHTALNQWFAPMANPGADGSAFPQLRQGIPGVKPRSGVHQRAPKTSGRPQVHSTFPFGGPKQVSGAPVLLPPTQLIIKPIPPKSRVETQIRVKMVIKYPPPGVNKLHLPTHTISKPKLQLRPPPIPSPHTLELSVSLVCTSAMRQDDLRQKALTRAATNPQRYLPPLNDEDQNSPQNGAEVRICQNCIGRERKRAARKKVKQADAEKAWCEDEAYRVVVFNTGELKDLKPDQDDPDRGRNGAVSFDAPVRIACYCRHHGEKLGFNMIFTLKDSTGRLVAQSMSDPIMITDDHKTAPMALAAPLPSTTSAMIPEQADSAGSVTSTTASDATTLALPEQHDIPLGFGQQQPSPSAVVSPTTSHASGMTARALSRPASPTQGGPSKKRKSSSTRIPDGLTMTKMETSPAPSGPRSAAVSPFPAPLPNFPTADAMFSASNGQGPYGTNPPTPGAVDQSSFFGNHNMDAMALAQAYSLPPSAHPSNAPSRAGSPSGLRNLVTAQSASPSQTSNKSPDPMPLAIANNFLSMSGGNLQMRQPPMIHKVIPGEGTRMGGIEVTILGTSFFQGIEVYFGTVRAVTTTYWGESSLVCLLPPSPVTGIVPVTCQVNSQPPSNLALPPNAAPPMFRYIDDSENQLMRLALQCVGGKTLGTEMDVSALARHLIDSFNASQGGGSGGDPSGGPMFNQASADGLELQLLKCLDVIDLDDSPHEANLDRKSSCGHTMLHLACSLGFHRLVAGLLARGADPNALDNGHFTPLHIAAVHDQPEIARRLMLAGANPRARSLSEETALDVADSGAVTRAIRFYERPTRSRSETSLHSRVSSLSSVRSLLEPLSQIRTHDEPLSPGEESPEYTSGDYDDEDPDEDNYLTMRRPSRRQSAVRLDREAQGRLPPTQAAVDDDLMSTANAMGAAFKEQFQQQLHQFQQSMALHLQNFPHLPQIPQIPTLPGRPMLPDYQAYFQQAPFMRRVTQYMPGMTGARPGSPDRQGAKIDHRWWDLSAYMSNSAVPPPSYEEIFPQEELDKKQASAAQAAAEAEADLKCSTLYDQASSSTTMVGSVETTEITEPSDEEKTDIPSVLKIGRKNAITKEQQEQFLRAREARLKRISNDRNLFFIWVSPSVPLLAQSLLSCS